MTIDWIGIGGVPLLTLVLFLITYLRAKSVLRGEPLRRIHWQMIVYACAFCFGMGYAMVFKDQLASITGWPNAWIPATALWAVALALFVWLHHKRTAPDNAS